MKASEMLLVQGHDFGGVITEEWSNSKQGGQENASLCTMRVRELL